MTVTVSPVSYASAAGVEVKASAETRGTSDSTASRATPTGCSQSENSETVSGSTPPDALRPSGPRSLRLVTLTAPRIPPPADTAVNVTWPVDFPKVVTPTILARPLPRKASTSSSEPEAEPLSTTTAMGSATASEAMPSDTAKTEESIRIDRVRWLRSPLSRNRSMISEVTARNPPGLLRRSTTMESTPALRRPLRCSANNSAAPVANVSSWM